MLQCECLSSEQTRPPFLFIIWVLMCFTVLYKRDLAARSLANAGRPVSAMATHCSHVTEPANGAPSASSGLEPRDSV